jgi:hypothetical protein
MAPELDGDARMEERGGAQQRDSCREDRVEVTENGKRTGMG